MFVVTLVLMVLEAMTLVSIKGLKSIETLTLGNAVQLHKHSQFLEQKSFNFQS